MKNAAFVFLEFLRGRFHFGSAKAGRKDRVHNFNFSSHFGTIDEKPTPHGADNLLSTKPLYLLIKTAVNIKIVNNVFLTKSQKYRSFCQSMLATFYVVFLTAGQKNREKTRSRQDAKGCNIWPKPAPQPVFSLRFASWPFALRLFVFVGGQSNLGAAFSGHGVKASPVICDSSHHGGLTDGNGLH
jgi:hypothetical protein